MLYGLSVFGFLVFGSEFKDFSTILSSTQAILFIVFGIGKTEGYLTTYPYLTTLFMFLVGEILKHISFWILLGIFIDNFSPEYDIYLKSPNRDQGLIFFLRNVLSEKWRDVKQKR